MGQPGGQFIDKRGNDVIEIGFQDPRQGFLLGVEVAIDKSVQIRINELLYVVQNYIAQLLFIILPLFEENPQGSVHFFKMIRLSLEFLLTLSECLFCPLAVLYFLLKLDVRLLKFERSLSDQFFQLITIDGKFFFGLLLGADIPERDNIAQRLAIVSLVQG